MGITPIGWFLIPLGIFVFMARPRWLYVLTLFFAPFSATAIINAGTGDSGQGFTPYLYFGLLLLLRECAGVAFRTKVRVIQAIKRPLSLLYLFAAVCLASLIMPGIINGRLEVMSDPSMYYRLIPLEYNRQIINHALRLILDIALVTVIIYRNLDLNSFYSSLRIYLSSGIFVCLWGIMQFCLYFISIPYPAILFNNSTTSGALGYGTILKSAGLLRVSSVATEPSFLSRILVGMLAMSVVAVRGRTYIFGKYADWVVIALLFSTILLTFSSTGLIGIAVLLLMLLFAPSSISKGARATKAVVLAVVAAAAVSYFTIPLVTDVVDSQLLSKNETGSTLERLLIITNNYQYFLKYPILGVGWSSVPTHDVIIGMLASCGIIGLCAFLLLIGTVLHKLKQNSKIPIAQVSQRNPSMMMLVCLSVTCAVYVISGGITVPDFWVVLSLSIAAFGIGNNLKDTIQAN